MIAQLCRSCVNWENLVCYCSVNLSSGSALRRASFGENCSPLPLGCSLTQWRQHTETLAESLRQRPRLRSPCAHAMRGNDLAVAQGYRAIESLVPNDDSWLHML